MKHIIKVLVIAVVVIFGLMVVNNYNNEKEEWGNYSVTVNADGITTEYKPEAGEIVLNSLEDTVCIIGTIGEAVVNGISGIIEGL